MYNSGQDVINAIRNTPFLGGKTFTAEALDMVRDVMYSPSCGDRSYASDLVIIVTDGNSNVQPEKTLPSAVALKEKVSHVMVVAIGKNFADMVEIRGMASDPVEYNVFTDIDFFNLWDIVHLITDGICDG